MKRFHFHLHVEDLDKSIAFYSRLFAAQPTRIEGDYAKWMLEDPRINFAISTRGRKAGIDHLGFQTDDPAELAAMRERAQSADMVLLDEGETTCCYARSDKHWVTDPQGLAWEHFHTLSDIPIFSDDKKIETRAACCSPSTTSQPAQLAGSGCCTASSRGKPLRIPAKPASTCC
jgi:hypothetical protein